MIYSRHSAEATLGGDYRTPNFYETEFAGIYLPNSKSAPNYVCKGMTTKCRWNHGTVKLENSKVIYGIAGGI